MIYGNNSIRDRFGYKKLQSYSHKSENFKLHSKIDRKIKIDKLFR